jgi:hypothetical protein
MGHKGVHRSGPMNLAPGAAVQIASECFDLPLEASNAEDESRGLHLNNKLYWRGEVLAATSKSITYLECRKIASESEMRLTCGGG